MINLILFILGSVFAVSPDYWGVGVVLLLSLCFRAASGRKSNPEENGDPQAQFQLGRMYELGDSVPQDYKESVKWFKKAAKQGHVTAHCSLGFMYYNGLGVLQDYTMAHLYWNIAAVSGDENAIKNRSVVEKKMTESHIERAKSLALEWLEREGKPSLGLEYQSIKSQKITEDTAYEMVACELELGEQQKGLWTKAFADAEGDENKQRALYIKMRVAELTGKPKVNRVTSSPTMGLSSEPPARPLGERASGEQDLLGYIMQAIGYEYSFSATNVEEGYISKRGIESYVYSLLKERSKEISDEQYEKITAVQSFVRQAVISHNAFIIEVRQVFGGMMTEPSEGFDFFDPIVGEFRTELENQGIFFDF